MNILLNNNPEEVSGDELTVAELLRIKNFTFKMMIIKINGNLVPKPDYETATIRPGDDVQVIHLISGG